jgi:arabinogalactan oligomer/maltooligosaccharide transport system substrate-binding protein
MSFRPPSPCAPLAPFLLAALCALPAAGEEILVWHAYRGAEKTAFEKVVAAFNQANRARNLQVATLAVPYDAYADKISAAVPRGKGPDVFIYAQDRLGGWVEAGKTIEPIEFYLEPGAADRFIPLTREAMTYQGQLYGLPVNFKVITQIYNKALVASPPKTTGELAATAKRLTDAAAGKFGLAYFYSDFYYHSPLMNAFGGGAFDAGRQPTLNAPGNVKSLELLLKWLQQDKFLPAEPSTTLITSLFNEGRAAIVWSGPWFLGEISPKVDYGLSLLPTADEAGGRPLRPWVTVEGAYIAQPSTKKDQAFLFIDYLTGLEAATVMALEGSQTPAVRAVYDNPRVKANPVLQAFRSQVENAVPMPNLAEMTMMWSPATTAMNMIVKRTASPQAALDGAQKDVKARISSLRAKN